MPRGRPKSKKAAPASKKKAAEEEPVEDQSEEEDEQAVEPESTQNNDAGSKKRGRGASEPAEEADEDEEDEEQSSSPSKKAKASSKKGKGRKASKSKAKKESVKRSSSAAASSSNSKKAKKDESEDDDDDEEYEVEKIIDVHFNKDGTRDFEIKWKGYGLKETTWEPESNLQCKELLDAFLAKLDNKDLSRARRLTTIQNSKSSAFNIPTVSRDRVKKSTSRSGKIVQNHSLVEEHRRINGRINSALAATELVVTDNESATDGQLEQISIVSKKGKPSILRGALLTVGVGIPIAAAILLSSSSTISFNNLSQPALQIINRLRERIQDFWMSH